MGLLPDPLLQSYSMLNDEWQADPVKRSFESPEIQTERPEQVLMFAPRLRNGSVSADITPLKAGRSPRESLSLEATLVFRYGSPAGYYYAGTSGFDTKFFVAKALPGPYYLARGYVGLSSSVLPGRTYRLRVEFSGSRIALFENDVQQFVVLDESYADGQVGLRTFRTQARFDNVTIRPAKPRCFVIMPFTSELGFVYGVMKEVVESYGIECVRADEVYLSRPVMDDVKTRIAEADLVIVDFTGRNPNVYYEAGLADAFKKDWIVLAQSSDDMTFDVRHIRSIRYSNTMGADLQLRKDLHQALHGLGYRLPPVSR